MASSKDKVLKFPPNIDVMEEGGNVSYLWLRFYEYRTSIGSKVSEVGDKSIDAIRRINNADMTSVMNALLKQGLMEILLPIPDRLQERHKINWEQSSLGGIAETLSAISETGEWGSKKISDIFSGDNVSKLSQNPLSGSVDPNNLSNIMGGANGGGITVSALNAANMAAKIIGQSSGQGSLFSNLLDLGTGTTQNPNLTATFRGPSLRPHNFAWKFIAETPEESKIIKKICSNLKALAYPENITNETAVFLKYPAECFPMFVAQTGRTPSEEVDNFLFKMRPCVITGVEVDYSPLGTPSFYTDFSPVVVTLSLELMETSFSTRDDFYNTTTVQDDLVEVPRSNQTQTKEKVPTK